MKGKMTMVVTTGEISKVEQNYLSEIEYAAATLLDRVISNGITLPYTPHVEGEASDGYAFRIPDPDYLHEPRHTYYSYRSYDVLVPLSRQAADPIGVTSRIDIADGDDNIHKKYWHKDIAVVKHKLVVVEQKFTSSGDVEEMKETTRKNNMGDLLFAQYLLMQLPYLILTAKERGLTKK